MVKLQFEGTVEEIAAELHSFARRFTAEEATPSVGIAEENRETPQTPAEETPSVQETPAPAEPAPAPVSTETASAAPAAAVPTTPAVPTAPPQEFTLEELMNVCAPLMDAGKLKELQALMGQFGVTSMQEIPAERYGELAMALRGLGARI